jgi:hypothetical protein
MRLLGILIIFINCLNVSGLQIDTKTSQAGKDKIKGIVFHDKNGNGSYEANCDLALGGIAVSNGQDIVLTGPDGTYELKVDDHSIVFVIKPRNWMVPVDEYQIPRFYYIHSTNGAKGTLYEGLSPSGELPESVNFTLYPQNESEKYDVLIFGDTQPRTMAAVHYFYRDVLEELIGIEAAFGVTLGDVVSDFLNLFEPMNQSVATLDLPWRYIIGNHDLEHSAKNDKNARGPWYRTYGPTYYSFSYGSAHFIVLDNIRLTENGNPIYLTGLGDKQMEFLKNELSRLDKDQLLVLMAHIPWEGSTPWQDDGERMKLYEMLSGFKNSFSLVAHSHEHYHHFIDKEHGFPGDQPHHMISIGAVCASWWMGAPDEYGIPHALGPDGTPKGYAMLHIDENNWKMSWKAARRPADFQMSIYVADETTPVATGELTVTANIFNALPSADVEVKIGTNGKWTKMNRVRRTDPFRVAIEEREKKHWVFPDDVTYWRRLTSSRISESIWESKIHDNTTPGVHVIYIRAKDKWWQYEGKRIVHLK